MESSDGNARVNITNKSGTAKPTGVQKPTVTGIQERIDEATEEAQKKVDRVKEKQKDFFERIEELIREFFNNLF